MLLTAPAWAGTYYVGFEDQKNGDYDYNDLVLQVTGVSLIQNAGSFSSEPVLDNSGSVFWNHASADINAAHDNIGYCVYGFTSDAGACAGSNKGLSPGALYLAGPGGGSVNDFIFAPVPGSGSAAASVLITITAATDEIGWYSLSAPGTIHWLNTNGGLSTGVTIATDSPFGLVANNSNGVGGQTFYSQTTLGNSGDPTSHFAVFAETASPEPSAVALFASGLFALSVAWKRRRRQTNFAKREV